MPKETVEAARWVALFPGSWREGDCLGAERERLTGLKVFVVLK